MGLYDQYLEKFNEYGEVVEVNYPIVMVAGLPGGITGEVVVFENNRLGQILHMGDELIEVLILFQEVVPVGMQLSRTGEQLHITVGDHLWGQIIDALGVVQSASIAPAANSQTRPVDTPPLSIAHRREITQPLLTGVTIVDSLLPLGKGQRELVVGDRKTGKSSFLLSAVKNQVLTGKKAIYAVIGKQRVEIEQIRQWLADEGILDQVVIIAATAQDAQSLVYLSPFTAMTIAEYVRDQGQDILVVLDDLTTHAKYYREITLLAKRFPGKDSYPGDIFFTHARILERSGNFSLSAVNPQANSDSPPDSPDQKSAAISCLPVVETTENDLTDYIVTNLIGITDGHLLFDSTEFAKGRRPAINSPLSVTRVGRQTQSLLHQDISQKLMAFINLYEKSLELSHLGAELSQAVKERIETGNQLYSLFNQPADLVVPLEVQLILISLVWSRLIASYGPKQLSVYRAKLIKSWQNPQSKTLIQGILQSHTLEQVTQKLITNKDRLLNL
jgi:F-type H+-transporting ATPase subunit alpha